MRYEVWVEIICKLSVGKTLYTTVVVHGFRSLRSVRMNMVTGIGDTKEPRLTSKSNPTLPVPKVCVWSSVDIPLVQDVRRKMVKRNRFSRCSKRWLTYNWVFDDLVSPLHLMDTYWQTVLTEKNSTEPSGTKVELIPAPRKFLWFVQLHSVVLGM